jgi:hypothetical protein
MTDKLPDKRGAESPLEYDWKWQFGWIDPADGVTPFDTAKVYGLAMYARDLELKVVELEQALKEQQDRATLKEIIFDFGRRVTRWTKLA